MAPMDNALRFNGELSFAQPCDEPAYSIGGGENVDNAIGVATRHA